MVMGAVNNLVLPVKAGRLMSDWVKRRTLILIGFYTITVLIAVLISIFEKDLSTYRIGFGPASFGPIDANFLSSFLASLWQDILFFGLVGVASLVAFSQDPKSYDDLAKVGFMYPRKNRSQLALDYNASVFKRLGVYAQKSVVSVKVLEYNSDLDAYKIHVDFDTTLANMFESDFYNDNFVVAMYLDDVTPPDGIRGAIESLHVRPIHVADSKKVDLLDGRILTFTESGFHQIPYRLGPNSLSVYGVSYWQWSKVGTPFNLGVMRFCSEFSLQISASCSGYKHIPYRARFKDVKDGEDWHPSSLGNVIDHGESHTIVAKSAVCPGQRTSLIFERPLPRNLS